jgi:hypothetical protein
VIHNSKKKRSKDEQETCTSKASTDTQQPISETRKNYETLIKKDSMQEQKKFNEAHADPRMQAESADHSSKAIS